MSDGRPMFIKRDDAKPCIFCQAGTFYTLKATGERMHRSCWLDDGKRED